MRYIKYFFIFIIFLFFINVLLFFGCKSNKIKNSIQYTGKYSNELIIFDNGFKIYDFEFCHFSTNDNSNITTDDGTIHIHWDGAKCKIFDPHKYKEERWYGFYIKYDKSKDFTLSKFNKLYIDVKGNLNGHQKFEIKIFNNDKIKEELKTLFNEYKTIKIDISKDEDVSKIDIPVSFVVSNDNNTDLTLGPVDIYIKRIRFVRENE